MKIDQQLLNQQQSHQIKVKHNPYYIWDQLNITLVKSQTYGYGIAISGGQCSKNPDASIYISDIVPGGPAENQLMIDDIILSVNGVNVENVEHSFVIRLLKEAKDFIHLVVKRKIIQQQQQQQPNNNTVNSNTVSDLIDYTLKQNDTSNNKRHNIAIQQTAATVMTNYQNNYQTNGNTNGNCTNSNNVNLNSNTNNLMSIMMSSTQSVSSMKPIKVQLMKKDKKDLFGIVLGCKYYIKEILPNSLASNETNLKKGDVLLKLNDLTPDQFSLQEANKILNKSKENRLNLVIKRDSLSSLDDEELSNLGEQQTKTDTLPRSNHQTIPSNNQQQQQNTQFVNNDSSSTQNTVTAVNTQQTKSQQLFKPIKSQNEMETNSKNSKFYSNKSLVLNFRTIVFPRENGVGIRLAGGNKVGIFVSDVQYNSPAERAGLRIRDKIMKVNGIDYSALTREEAVQHILSLQNIIEMVVAHSPEEYESNATDPLGCDSFYVRAHFNFSSKNSNDLEFRINDILHVTDSLYNCVIGQWVASKLDRSENGGEITRGTIPNQFNAEQLVQTAQTIEQLYSSSDKDGPESNSASNTTSFGLGASARMSIRMKLAGKNSLAKRSKSASRSTTDLDSNSNMKISKANTFYSNKYPAYERVVLKEVNFTRPIVIFGPLADVAREKLKSEFPSKYEIPESYSTDPNDPNNQSSGVIKLASIKAIIEKGRHCLLDITPNAVDHLNYAQYFPICIYLKAHSRAHTKDLRQKYAKNLKTKSSKRLFDNALKLQNYYSHLFTSTIPLDSNQWFKKLKEIIDLQQNQPIWISEELDKLLNQQQQQQPNQQQGQPQNVPNDQQSTPIHPGPQQSNQFDMTLQQQQFINKQNQLLLHANPNLEMNQQTNQAPNNRYIFDDNFEFPIYTTANPTLSMSGAASSTYSLYEENNRCSFAASDSDICASTQNNQKLTSSISNNLQNDSSNQIYSTNFNNKPTNTNNMIQNSYQQNQANNNSDHIESLTPLNLTRVKSDPSLVPNQQDVYMNKPQLRNYEYLNKNLVNNQQNQQTYQVINHNSNGLTNQISNSNLPVNHNDNNNDWKKFATYSANTYRNIQNGLENDMLPHTQHNQKNGSVNFKTNSNSSSPIKSANCTPIKNRPSLNDSNFVSYQLEKHVNDQFRRLSTTSDYLPNNDLQQSLQVNPQRNSGSYSSYKLIKNSQSNLMPSTNKSIIDQPMIFNSDNNQSNELNKQLSTGSLLKPICTNGNDQIDNNNCKLSSSNINKHQLFKQELSNKLNDKLKPEQNELRAIKNNCITNTNNSMQMITNNSMKSNHNTDIATLRRKKESPSRPPPPILPKPKFILPQTSTTNLVLQRNLKSKSELNIATPSTFSSSSAACSSSSSASSSSSSSSSASSTQGNDINIDHDTKLISQSTLLHHQQQHHQQQQQQLNQQQPLRNKLLENNSLISSSQGYQSDTWESHSSRQSFDMDSQINQTTRYTKNLIKPSKQINESKLAKTTVLSSNMINTELNNLSDGSINGIISGSDDTDSIPNDNQNQYYHQKNSILQKPTSSSSSTVSTSSTSSSSSAVALSSTTTISTNSSNIFNTMSANGIVSNTNESRLKRMSTTNEGIELPIYYQTNSTNNNNNNDVLNTSSSTLTKSLNSNSYYNNQQNNTNNNNIINNNNNKYSDLYSNDSIKYRTSTYTAHYNDNGVYRKLSLDSNSNCSIIASANGIFDSNGGILESADTGVSLNVPEGAIANGCSFDLYFKVCHCKSNITNAKGELLSNPIVMCGPRGIRFLKPIELQIPHFTSIDGQSWSYAFKTNESISEEDDPYNWDTHRFHKKTLINSVTVQLDSF